MSAALDLFTWPPGMSRQAKYAPEFLDAMRGRKFRNPSSGNENVFESLPEEEQKRIHDHWQRVRQPQEETKPQRNIPEEALKATRLTTNQDPARYEGVDVEYGSLGEDDEEIKQELHSILGEQAERLGMTPEQLALDLAGGGGLTGELDSIKILTLQNGPRSAIMVSGSGDNIHEMDRELFFNNGELTHVHNKILELDESTPAGTGTRMLATQLASIKEAGGKYIKTTGSGCFDCDYKGYYVWPLLGFEGKLHENDVDQMPRWLLEELEDTGGGPPYDISELMSFPEGRKYWLEHGSEIELELATDNDDVLQKYVDRTKGAGKTVGQFLHNASDKSRGKDKGSDKVERAPKLDKDDLKILSKIWNNLPKRKKKDKNMTTKNATRAIIDLAKKDPSFRKALLSEVVKEGNININIRDFAMDEFSQHQMLRNLREGDLVEILFEPNELHPQRIATRLVASDFDPEIPGVLLRGTGTAEEMLADRGQGMPLVWEPGGGEPAYPVIKLKIVHSKLAAEAEKNRDKKASEILEALGGRRKLESLLGARDIKLYKNEMLFSWPNRMASKGTSCGISMLDDGQCDVMFMTADESGALNVVAQYKVPTNELAQTFEKQTGWFLRLP